MPSAAPTNRAGEIVLFSNLKLIYVFVGTNQRYRRLRRGARAYVGAIRRRMGMARSPPRKATRGGLETGTTPFFIDAIYSKSGGFPRFWRATGTARTAGGAPRGRGCQRRGPKTQPDA